MFSCDCSTSEGGGVELIQLIQMSFSVLNRLLLLRSPDLPLSPTERALSSQPAGRQHQHIVAVIAQYIYHRHNPRLPTLGTVLLKRLALVSLQYTLLERLYLQLKLTTNKSSGHISTQHSNSGKGKIQYLIFKCLIYIIK